MKKWCAFTICFEPSMEWFKRNCRRLRGCFDKWILVYGAVPDMAKVENIANLVDMSARGREERADLCHELDIELWDLSSLGGFTSAITQEPYQFDKLDMCNIAYRQAIQLNQDYIWQIDADEWYLKTDVEIIQDVVEKHNIPILNIPENKYWKNYMILNGGIWDGYPPRIFEVREGWSFGDHRPPNITNGIEKVTCNPKYLTQWDEIEVLKYMRQNHDNGGVMDHFCYVDKEQVRLKSKFFSELRKDHPTYSKYYEWYCNYYLPWYSGNKANFWLYHPADKDRKMKFNLQLSRAAVQHRYPEDWDFLKGFIGT